jgi:hypothetical protein
MSTHSDSAHIASATYTSPSSYVVIGAQYVAAPANLAYHHARRWSLVPTHQPACALALAHRALGDEKGWGAVTNAPLVMHANLARLAHLKTPI